MKLEISRSRNMLFAIFLLMMLDYLLTFYGINYFKCIQEANPLLIDLYKFDLRTGLLIRTIQCLIPVLLLNYAISISYKKIYYKFIKIILIVECIVMMMHINWLIKYFDILY